MKSLTSVLIGMTLTIGPLQAMTIDFTFMRSHKCSSTSPALKIENIPRGTTEISIKMTDLDMRSYDHGGGYLENKGGIAEVVNLPEGALQNYRGPCPPNFSSFGHDYEFSVKAYGKERELLGEAKKSATFSAKAVPE